MFLKKKKQHYHKRSFNPLRTEVSIYVHNLKWLLLGDFLINFSSFFGKILCEIVPKEAKRRVNKSLFKVFLFYQYALSPLR